MGRRWFRARRGDVMTWAVEGVAPLSQDEIRELAAAMMSGSAPSLRVLEGAERDAVIVAMVHETAEEIAERRRFPNASWQ